MAMNVIQQAIGAANMVANAFSGGNPMATILGALGGVDGLKSIASQAQSLIGPLTGTFGAATAISGMLKGMGNNIFSNVKEIPIPKITNALNVVNNLNNIGNIAGVGVGNVGNLVNAITNSPISSLLAQSPLNAALNASNLLNSSIPLPSFVQSASVINSISSTSINNILNTSQNSLLNSIVGTTTQLNAALNAAALHNSAITLPSSINPSNYTRMINRNTGVNVSINPSPAPAVILPVNISNVSNTNNSYTSSTVIRNVNIVSPGYNINSLLNSTINVNIPPALTINSINKVLNNNPGVNYDVTGTVFKVLK
jgi:hypothetical protein